MGIVDIEFLKQGLEKLKNGNMLQNATPVLSNPIDVINAVCFIGLVSLGVYCYGSIFDLWRKKVDIDDDNPKAVPKFVDPQYMKKK